MFIGGKWPRDSSFFVVDCVNSCHGGGFSRESNRRALDISINLEILKLPRERERGTHTVKKRAPLVLPHLIAQQTLFSLSLSLSVVVSIARSFSSIKLDTYVQYIRAYACYAYNTAVVVRDRIIRGVSRKSRTHSFRPTMQYI